MTDAKQRYQTIASLLKKHNISKGLIRLVTGLTQLRVCNILNSTKGKLNEEHYHLFLDAINTIKSLSKEELYQKYVRGYVQPQYEIKIPNVKFIRNFLEENNIQVSHAADICGYPTTRFWCMVSTTRRYDMSTDTRNEIISKLKQYLIQVNHD